MVLLTFLNKLTVFKMGMFSCGRVLIHEMLIIFRIFSMVLTSLWIPNVPKISGKTERKAIACGSIALLEYVLVHFSYSFEIYLF